MCAPAAPAPPDPHETSAASTSTNVGTAIANANLGNVNQVTPDGSLTYGQSGTYKWTDPYTGQSYDIPSYTATQTLSAAGQGIHDTNVQTQQNLATLGKDQSAKLGTLLATPFDGSNDGTEARLMELGNKRLQPLLDQRRSASETDLINRGIRPGSDAYDRAQANVSQGENDAYDQLLLSGHQQAFSEGQSIRQEPINEITALLSGSQVAQPNYVNTSMPSIATTDTAGLINSNYDQRLAQWQQQQAQSQGILGGLFGLGASAIKFSDERLKTDIEEIGETKDGQPLYSYRYRGSSEPQIGLIAQDVKKSHPEAVIETPSGYLAVDYSKALGSAFG